jgi:hypothetical protein
LGWLLFLQEQIKGIIITPRRSCTLLLVPSPSIPIDALVHFTNLVGCISGLLLCT